jgi:hypothetical protein
VRMRAWMLALGLLAATAPLGAWESLRLPWIFSDDPDLSADFGFSPGKDGKTHVELVIGGRFAGFQLPRGAARSPRLSVVCEFNDPGALEAKPEIVSTVLDLEDVLKEYGVGFSKGAFKKGSRYVYKAELALDLAPGDYNVSIALDDRDLDLHSRRTLHMFVPAPKLDRWAVGDLKFISAVGKRLDAKGREQRVLDPNPWRQVGGPQDWDLLVAYRDLGPRPGGKLMRRHSVQRLRGGGPAVFTEESEAPPKQASQVWLVRVPADKARQWQAGTYTLKVELWSGAQKVEGIKTFQVLP